MELLRRFFAQGRDAPWTPYRRLGLLHQKYRDHFGVDSDDVLVRSQFETAWRAYCPSADTPHTDTQNQAFAAIVI